MCVDINVIAPGICAQPRPNFFFFPDTQTLAHNIHITVRFHHDTDGICPSVLFYIFVRNDTREQPHCYGQRVSGEAVLHGPISTPSFQPYTHTHTAPEKRTIHLYPSGCNENLEGGKKQDHGERLSVTLLSELYKLGREKLKREQGWLQMKTKQCR